MCRFEDNASESRRTQSHWRMLAMIRQGEGALATVLRLVLQQTDPADGTGQCARIRRIEFQFKSLPVLALDLIALVTLVCLVAITALGLRLKRAAGASCMRQMSPATPCLTGQNRRERVKFVMKEGPDRPQRHHPLKRGRRALRVLPCLL